MTGVQTCALPILWVATPHLLDLPVGTDLVTRLNEPTGRSARHELLVSAWSQWREHMWWGIGPMHLAAQAQVHANHPHNIYLQLFVEWGAPIAMLLLGLLLAGCVARWRRWLAAGGTSTDLAAAGALMAVVSGSVDAAFSGNAVMPVSQIWLATAWGIWMGSTPAPSDRSASPWIGRSLAVLVLLGFAAMGPVVSRQWSELDRLLKSALSDQAATRLQPRFWSHGRIVPGGATSTP